MLLLLSRLFICHRENYGHPEVHIDRLPMPQPYSGVGPTDWNEALDIVTYGSPEQVCFMYLYRRNLAI